MASRSSLLRRGVTGTVAMLVLTATALVIALAATASSHAGSRALSRQLVPAAASAIRLISLYSSQQSALRDYVTDGPAGTLAPYRTATGQIAVSRARLTGLVAVYPAITGALPALESAQRAWLAQVAAPQLAAMARGDVARARAMEADVPRVRPFVLAVRAQGARVQSLITAEQQRATNRLARSQSVLLGALIGMCVVAAAMVADAGAVLWFLLLRPFLELRRAVDAVAGGEYGTTIPAVGPAELADLGRSTELMRTKLVVALARHQLAESRFQRLFDLAPDATIAVTSDGSIAMANAQAGRLFGYSPDELAGLPAEILVPEAGKDALAAGRADYFAQPVPPPADTLRLTGLRRDGSEFPAEVSLSGLLTDRGMLVAASIRDVSERLAMETEQERLRAQAEQERIERGLHQSQRLESLGQLVGGVAHDFNNLLNVILGYAGFTAEQVAVAAKRDKDLEPALADIEQVRSAAEKAARLVRQLLTFARHEAITPEIVDLNESVSDAVQLLRRTLGEHVALVIHADPGLWHVSADRGQLEQVLVNLAVNARDAMPAGGRLTIGTASVEILDGDGQAGRRVTLAPGRYARLRVSDTGTGMDRATQDRVFEPFFTTKPMGHGTGLGLATVYGIVTAAGGSIDVESETGMGTAFSVYLPATDAAVTPEMAASGPAADDRGHGETVLIVEDEESLRELTSRVLTRNGYQVQVAASGVEAIRLADRPGMAIDLLLTDVVMPQMLGDEVADQVRAILPGVPVLFMSGYAEPVLHRQGVAAARMEILEKPFTEAALLARVREAIRR